LHGTIKILLYQNTVSIHHIANSNDDLIIPFLSILHAVVHVRVAAGWIRSAIRLCHQQLLDTYNNDAYPAIDNLILRSRATDDDELNESKYIRDKLAYLWCFYTHVLWEIGSVEECWEKANSKHGSSPTSNKQNETKIDTIPTEINFANISNTGSKSKCLTNNDDDNVFVQRRVKSGDWKDYAIDCLQKCLRCPLVGNHHLITVAISRFTVLRTLSITATKLTKVQRSQTETSPESIVTPVDGVTLHPSGNNNQQYSGFNTNM
jgi:hypothetical protein